MRLFDRFRSSSSSATPLAATGGIPAHHVDSPHYVIGDIHGRMDLLDRLCTLIEQDVDTHPDMTTARVVYLGDYVDRGDQSAQVLTHLYELHQAQPDRHICLKGNHEVLMLNFLEDPKQHGARWLRYGGMQTLASFGIRGFHERMNVDDMDHIAAQLEQCMPDGMWKWLKTLPQIYRTGNVICVHAALNPDRPWNDQSDRTRMWGHKEFFAHPRTDGYWVAHGHTILEQASIEQGRISLDTGGYATGRLTAAALIGSDVRLIQTTR